MSPRRGLSNRVPDRLLRRPLRSAKTARPDAATDSKRPRTPKPFAEFSNDPQFATTLARGLEILRCFTPSEPSLRNQDIAARTGLAKATVSRLTYTLVRLGYLETERGVTGYQLGPATLSMGYPILAGFALRQAARPAMRELADQTKGSVSMGIRDRLNIVFVESSRGSALTGRLPDVGLSCPIVSTSLGRAYLAGLKPDARNALINEIKVKTPEHWTHYGENVLRSMQDYEKKGFCINRGEMSRDLHAVGVPLQRPGSDKIVVFNCALRAFLLKPGQLENEIGPRLVAMVAGLENL